MNAQSPFLRGVARGVTVAVCAVSALSAVAADALFPRPLHIVRRIDDPLATTAVVVHEYCAGSRIVTVHADRVAIADYASQQIIEIDRASASYSVASFDEIARDQQRVAGASAVRDPLRLVKADTYEARFDDETRLEIAIDRRFELSREGMEALIGAAYPSRRTTEHAIMLEAARAPRDRIASESEARPSFALPVSQVFTFAAEGKTLVLRNTVIAVSNDLVPPELLSIPPGARRVESRRARAAREPDESNQR